MIGIRVGSLGSQYRVTEGITKSGAEGHQVAGVDMRRGMRHDGLVVIIEPGMGPR